MNLFNKLTQHANDFYLFYFFTYITIFSVMANVILLVADGQFHIYRYVVGNLIILISGAFCFNSNMKLLKPVLVMIGILVVIMSFYVKGIITINYSYQTTEVLITFFSVCIGLISILNRDAVKTINKIVIKNTLKVWIALNILLFVVVRLFWLIVNRTFGLFVINHHERRKVHAKEAS